MQGFYRYLAGTFQDVGSDLSKCDTHMLTYLRSLFGECVDRHTSMADGGVQFSRFHFRFIELEGCVCVLMSWFQFQVAVGTTATTECGHGARHAVRRGLAARVRAVAAVRDGGVEYRVDGYQNFAPRFLRLCSEKGYDVRRECREACASGAALPDAIRRGVERTSDERMQEIVAAPTLHAAESSFINHSMQRRPVLARRPLQGP